MIHGSVNPPFPAYFAIWFLISVAAAAFFRFNKNVGLKRRIWAPFLVLSSVVFLGVVWSVTRRAEVLYVILPAVGVLTLVNLRTVRFCSACGATARGWSPWRRPAFCARCGAALPQR